MPRYALPWCLVILTATMSRAADPVPNLVIIYADDLGYGDLACYGHPTIRTPNLDKLAAEGMRFTSFYSAAEVCTPSRAALLTGRLPLRSGMCHDQRRVLFPSSAGGLPADEITLAKALKTKGYASICIGKWHLGHLPPYLPTLHGFDSFFGMPYVNDMDRVADPKLGRSIFFDPKVEYWRPPLMRDDKIIERPAQQPTLTKRYTEEAVRFIAEHRQKPFFLYLAHTMPHVPLFASPEFKGRSPRGIYGDVVEEIDWSTGEVMRALKDAGLRENTLVLFSSDNGPWLTFQQHGGSAGLLREGKGSTYEGGMRVPGIFSWPGKIPSAVVSREMASTLDIFPTCLALAGVPLAADRVLDGHDIAPVLFGKGPSPRDTMAFYRGTKLFAYRLGSFKAHFITRSGYGQDKPVTHDPALLYNLDEDPSERFDLAKIHPDVVKAITATARAFHMTIQPGENQLEKTLPEIKE